MRAFTFRSQRRKFTGLGVSLHRKDRGTKFAIPFELDRDSVLTFRDGRSNSSRVVLIVSMIDVYVCGGSIGVVGIERMAEEVCSTPESCQSHDNR